MILCICLSTALDITYELPRLELGGTNRVASVTERPGGKAVNVARILHRLNEPVRLLAPAGGRTGEAVADGLRRAGIDADLVESGIETRRTIALVPADGETTMLTEPAALDCWPQLLARAESAMAQATVVVVSGAMPAGVPDDGPAALVRLARSADRPILVDTSGPALARALAAGPAMVKPNADELAELTGVSASSVARRLESAARALAASSGVTVVASLGPAGLYAARCAGGPDTLGGPDTNGGPDTLGGPDTNGGPDGSRVAHHVEAWRARPVQRLAGNPTGAGDAVVAGLARGLAAGAEMPAMLADCLALAAAAVLSPAAGDLDPDEYRRQQQLISDQGVS